MPIGEKSRFQPAHVQFFDPRRGYGRAFTKSGRRVYIPRQALIDEGLVTLEPGPIEVSLDELNPSRVEQVRLPEPAPEEKPKPVPKKRR